MTKSENTTVSLPALPVGRVYIDIAETLAVRLGCGVGMRDFNPGSHTAAIHDGTYAYGLRQCGGDGGAKGADATDAVKRAGVVARCDAIDDGTHVYGAGGGGARLSTYEVEMKAYMIGLVGERIRETGNKKGKAKAWYADHGDDPKAVFLAMCDLVAATVDGADGADLFKKNWPSHDGKVKEIVRVLDEARVAKDKIRSAKGEPDSLGLAA